MKSRTQGFTLIELIVVIVILGILAAVAAPKFASLDADAKTAVVKGAGAALQSAAVITYSHNTAIGAGTPGYTAIAANAVIDSAITLTNTACVVEVKYTGTAITATADLTQYCS